jgi:peptidoglycan hydrolase CwlO-like protein
MTAKDEEIAKLQGDMECKQKDLDEKAAALEAKETELATAKEELEGAKASLTTAEQTLAERDQQITDLNAQITELQNNPGAEPAAGAAPQNNGGGADAPGVAVNQYVYDPNLSYEENGKAEKAWNEAHGK